MAVLRVTGRRSKQSSGPSKKGKLPSGRSLNSHRPKKASLNSVRKRTTKRPDTTSKLRLYDNTMLQDFRRCARMWFFRHWLGWRPEVPGSALIFGASWHAAMDVVWEQLCWKLVPRKQDSKIIDLAFDAFNETWEAEGGPETLENFEPTQYDKAPFRTPDTAHEMLIHYLRERRPTLTAKGFELVDIERPFAVPVLPDDPDLFYVGRLDKTVRLTNLPRKPLRIHEHKTSSMFAKNGGFQQRYIDSFSPNSQVDGYLYAGSMLYKEPIKDVHIDASLVHALHHDVFRFIPVEKQWQTIDAWLWEAMYWMQQLEANKKAAAHHVALPLRDMHKDMKPQYLAAFPRNTNVCTDFSGCPFIDICRMTPDPTTRERPPGFITDFWSPFDVLKLEQLFKEV